MQIFTVSSIQKEEATAISEIKAQLLEKSSDEPDFLQVYFYQAFDCAKLKSALKEQFPLAKFIGVGTSVGTFDEKNLIGFASASSPEPKKSRFAVQKPSNFHTETGIFVIAYYDKKSCFGCTICDTTNLTNLKIAENVRKAATDAKRQGVIPDLIIVHYTTDIITRFCKQFEEILGVHTALIGGGVGNEEFGSKLFTQDEIIVNKSSYLMAFLYLKCEVEVELYSISEPLELKARVTRASGKEIIELNNQPAADLICRWEGVDSTKMDILEITRVINRLKQYVMIGKPQNSITNEILYNVTIINGITDNRGIATNYQWEIGDEVMLMHADNSRLPEMFFVKKAYDYRNVLAQFHIMCEFFGIGNNAKTFKSQVVDIVRTQHLVDNYVVISSVGEIGKDITDPIILGNYSVATVSFYEQAEARGHE